MRDELFAMSLKAAVLGSPISHSLSPTLHRAAYAALGRDIDYTAIDTATEMLAQRLGELDSNSMGYSLTMPLKRDVLGFIKNQSELVIQTGCANTVYRGLDQDWALENTDVFGIVQTIKYANLAHIDSASIIGSGATASSALSALSELGVTEITCYARNQAAFSLLRDQSELLGVIFHTVHLEREIVLAGDLVISTVPSSAQKQIIGMLKKEQELSVLLDIAYNPWPSELAGYWRMHHGGEVLSGVEMLLWQAWAQVELFTGEQAPIEVMRAALPKEFSTG
jgi:shikimate dehydrogenase